MQARHVQAARAAALHLREADLVQAAEVASFIGYVFNNEKAIAKQAGFIALTDRQLKKARYTVPGRAQGRLRLDPRLLVGDRSAALGRPFVSSDVEVVVAGAGAASPADDERSRESSQAAAANGSRSRA